MLPWTARRLNQSILKEINLNTHWKNWHWSWGSHTLATWCKELTHWKRPWCWERLRLGEGSNRGWDGWMPSLTQWTGVWANTQRQWRTGKPDMQQSVVTKNWTQLKEWTTMLPNCYSVQNHVSVYLLKQLDCLFWVKVRYHIPLLLNRYSSTQNYTETS